MTKLQNNIITILTHISKPNLVLDYHKWMQKYEMKEV